jgi:hypothetical protein
MPYDMTPTPLFPDVPADPGVPSVPRQDGGFGQASDFADDGFDAGGSEDFLGGFGGPQWGIFDDTGFPIISAESVNRLEYREEKRVADFPIEKGGFESYNKVRLPYEARLEFVQGGTDDDRAQTLDSVKAAVDSLELYTVVMQDYSFESANVISYNIQRSSRGGVQLLRVEVYVQEVRIVEAGHFDSTKDASAQTPADQGTNNGKGLGGKESAAGNNTQAKTTDTAFAVPPDRRHDDGLAAPGFTGAADRRHPEPTTFGGFEFGPAGPGAPAPSTGLPTGTLGGFGTI